MNAISVRALLLGLTDLCGPPHSSSIFATLRVKFYNTSNKRPTFVRWPVGYFPRLTAYYVVGFVNSYPLDSDLSGDGVIQPGPVC